MNHLPPVEGATPLGDPDEGVVERYRLPRHAHVVVYDRRERDLVTVYDCGAAQKPPSAQFLGHLVRVDADATVERGPTGYTVSLRGPATLERQSNEEWVVRGADR
jgi:hypothetical protein